MIGAAIPRALTHGKSAADVMTDNVDPFANVNACTPEQIELLVRVLEIRGAQPRQRRMREQCFRAAKIAAGDRVLEIGCGTGIVARELAEVVGPDGKVVGIDVSPALLARARAQPSAGPIEYHVADAYQVPFADRSFDSSCAVTLFAHLGNANLALEEMIRVTCGKVMVLDQDYQTLVFEHSDTALTREILLHGADYNVVDGWCGRKLPGLFVRHRLGDVQCWPFVYSERDARSYLITIAERFAALAVQRDAVSSSSGRAWLQEIYDRAVQGEFFASLNYYFVFGSVPD